LAVFIPSLIAFASAFHCFLTNNEVFEGPVASILKTFEMMLGEVDFSDNFMYDSVLATEGANHSVQLMMIVFIIYMILIVMNLIVALMVNKMDVSEAEVILAKQRIEEISSMADLTSVICSCFRNVCSSQKKEQPSTVCITVKPKKERNGFYDYIFSKWQLNDHDSTACKEITIGRFRQFHPTNSLVDETIEMLKGKKTSKLELMKEVKDVQAETEEKLNKLVDIADGDWNDIMDENPKLARQMSVIEEQLQRISK
jgi:hypothetical protein